MVVASRAAAKPISQRMRPAGVGMLMVRATSVSRKSGDERRLIVLAYDDREITFDGKKVVGPDGGTFRATGRMREALRGRFELTEMETPTFKETIGLDGRIHFYVHPNPANKILHTALVGEMNGVVHAGTLGTPQEETWGAFGGQGYLKHSISSSREHLNNYDPDLSVKNTGIGFGSNRVSLLVLKRVRLYSAGGLVSEVDVNKVVHESE